MQIAVIRGGVIRSYDSHLSANEIISDLRLGGFKVLDVIIDENGIWYERGIKKDYHSILVKVDAIINTTIHREHLNFLNKLQLKKILEEDYDFYNIRQILKQLDLQTTNTFIVKDKIDQKQMHLLWRKIHLPVVLKSRSNILPEFIAEQPKEILDYIKSAQDKGDDVLMSNYIRGDFYHLVLVKNLRGEKIYSSIILESYKKYGRDFYKIAEHLSDNLKKEIIDTAKKIHKHLDAYLATYSFVKNKNGLFLINISTKPKFYKDSLLYEAFNASGVTFREIVQSLQK